MAQTGVKSRQSNMELLRIIAMLMIITLHYLDKGNVLPDFAGMTTVNHYIAWILEAFCFGAVNLYVLISGYFLSGSKFTFQKLFLLWIQVLFYSWVIGAIFLLTGTAGEEATSLYELIFIALPVTAGHYWFATVYVLLFAVSPFLNAAIHKMNKEQHRACVAVLLVIFSLWNTVLPMTMPLADGEGMDIAWFVTLYVIAAYLRKYPEDIKRKKSVYILGYFLSCLVTFGFGIALLWIDGIVGKLGGYATNWYAYNSLPILIGSLCLFCAFIKTEIKGTGIGKCINTVAGATFGVYLIHEHRYVRYLWQQWLGVEQSADMWWMILHLVGSVLLVFTVCTIIEWIRKWLFGLVTKRRRFQKLFYRFQKLEEKINGDA